MNARIKVLTALVWFVILTVSSTINAFGQITAIIDFRKYENQYGKEIKKNRKKETKSFLKKHRIYLVVRDTEIKIDYYDDTILRIPNLPEEFIKELKHNELLLIKFRKRNKCYYALLPNAFFYYNRINDLWIYKYSNWIPFYSDKKRYAINITTYSGVSMPLVLIPCLEYNGEYDHGL